MCRPGLADGATLADLAHASHSYAASSRAAAIYRRIARSPALHKLFDAWLICLELRQMLFGRCMSRRHLRKPLLQPLKDNARTR
jgi:hypothetical protein